MKKFFVGIMAIVFVLYASMAMAKNPFNVYQDSFGPKIGAAPQLGTTYVLMEELLMEADGLLEDGKDDVYGKGFISFGDGKYENFEFTVKCNAVTVDRVYGNKNSKIIKEGEEFNHYGSFFEAIEENKRPIEMFAFSFKNKNERTLFEVRVEKFRTSFVKIYPKLFDAEGMGLDTFVEKVIEKFNISGSAEVRPYLYGEYLQIRNTDEGYGIKIFSGLSMELHPLEISAL